MPEQFRQWNAAVEERETDGVKEESEGSPALQAESPAVPSVTPAGYLLATSEAPLPNTQAMGPVVAEPAVAFVSEEVEELKQELTQQSVLVAARHRNEMSALKAG